MRITNGMMIKNMMRNMNKNLSRMDKAQQKLSTGKKFQLPSDDPIGVSRSLKLHTDLSKIEQFKRNLKDAKSWLEVTEDSIAQVGEVLQRARELTVQASNGTNSVEDLRAISAEIGQLRDQIIKSANATYAGRSIFTGYKTDAPLLDENGKYKLTNFNEVTNFTNSGSVVTNTLSYNEITSYNIGVADSIEINTVGSSIFGKVNGSLDNADFSTDVNGYQIEVTAKQAKSTGADESYLVAIFDDLKNALDNGDTDIINKSIKRLDNSINNLLSVRAEIGAKMNRLELTEKRLDSETVTFTKLLSENEDADMAEVIMNLKMEENVYRASLSAGAKVIQPTLIDFLR